jgi:hypothetical protein
VDAVLFNGGSLSAVALRQRLLEQIAAWQGSTRPIELENAVPDLAVALGAARFGKLLHGHSGRIAAGAARAVFLEAQAASADQGAPPALVCVLPRNASTEEVFHIDLPGLEVRTNQLVSFQACSSTRHGGYRAGDVLPWKAEAFHRLPSLQTIVRTANEPDTGNRTKPIRLTVTVNALGLLQIFCVSTDPLTPQSWPLEFNLRPHERSHGASSSVSASEHLEANATVEIQQAARGHLAITFTRPAPRSARLTANATLNGLERIIGLPRHEWNVALLRTLWPVLNERMSGRKLSAEHEESWLALAGFLLRPGFGFAHDGLRMDELWQLQDVGLCYPGKRSKVQEHILWRRVAGGLSANRQDMLLAGELNGILEGRASPELVRLAGSLERLTREAKANLIETFIAGALDRMETKQHCAPYLAALGLLLNRAPLYAGPETVVVPEFVERAYVAFRNFDWAHAELLETQNLFLRAARVVDDRNLDVPKSLRNQIARKLENAGVAPIRTTVIKDFTPVRRVDRNILYGEALPPGLVLGTEINNER